MYKAVYFKSINSGSVWIDNYGGIRVKVYAETTMDLKGKAAYLPLDDKTDPPTELINKKDRSTQCFPKTGKTLYICSESKVPRAIIRNSEYKITIIRDNADYVVVPMQSSEEVASRECNLACIITANGVSRIIYFLVSSSWNGNMNSVKPELIEKIKNEILNKLNPSEDEEVTFYYLGNFQRQKIYFVKKCQELEEILTGEIVDKDLGRDKYKVILDTRLQIDATTEINTEMLQIWHKMAKEDKNLLCKSIINSEWQKYPCTISAFIDDVNLEYWGGEQMKYVLRSIDHDYYRHHHAFRAEREMQPEDWNLLQDWLMLKAGVGPDGGFKPFRGEGIERLVRKAYCVKPLKITEPTLYQEIEARLKN